MLEGLLSKKYIKNASKYIKKETFTAIIPFTYFINY
jgi:hypothetical protein